MIRVHPRDNAALVKAPRRRGWWQRLPSRRAWLAGGALLLACHVLWFYASTRPSPHVAETLWQVASAPMTAPRGIVLPLFDGIAVLGVSLILELRAMEIELPIEVPHCGDLSPALVATLAEDAAFNNVRLYDVCVQASEAFETGPVRNERPLFCESLSHCHARFRSFDIKVIALVFSRFDEIMMLDADVLFLQDPTSLWGLDKFVQTGTLFFNDRISFTDEFLAHRVNSKHDPDRSKLHEFVETFDRARFQRLANPTPREEETSQQTSGGGLRTPVTPSAYLQATHTWQLRAGHHADSSLMLWSKARQPRATAILASFVTLQYAHRPSSYGDKEFYFLACEVADADYAFSDFGVGSIGADARPSDGVLCGDALHFYPAADDQRDGSLAAPLYINSDHIASWRPETETLYHSNARPASLYPGSFAEKDLPQECPFDVTMQKLSAQEISRFQRRQQLHQRAEELLAQIAAG